MNPLTLYQDDAFKTTAVSNYFIDEYMSSANASQIKVYLYLLRMMGEGLSISLCSIADFFDYPEKDILRILKYWDKQGLLSMEVNAENQLVGIKLNPFPVSTPKKAVAVETPITVTATTADSVKEAKVPSLTPQREFIYEKKPCSLDDLKEFKAKDSTTELLFIIESYLKKNLTPSDLQTIYFFMETLNMSVDLVDYLIQYCIERGKTDFHYIEKVAISWTESGVKTPAQAKEFSFKYAKIVYTVMKALGKSTVPTEEEASYVHTWSKDMGFTDDIILEACRRSVSGTDKNRLQYADTILKNWQKDQVHTIKDIEKLDEDFKKRKSTSGTSTSGQKKGSFHQFEQRNYDFDALEKKLRKD